MRITASIGLLPRQYWLASASVLACFRVSIGLLSRQYWLASAPVLACFRASIGLLSRQYWRVCGPIWCGGLSRSLYKISSKILHPCVRNNPDISYFYIYFIMLSCLAISTTALYKFSFDIFLNSKARCVTMTFTGTRATVYKSDDLSQSLAPKGMPL